MISCLSYRLGLYTISILEALINKTHFLHVIIPTISSIDDFEELNVIARENPIGLLNRMRNEAQTPYTFLTRCAKEEIFSTIKWTGFQLRFPDLCQLIKVFHLKSNTIDDDNKYSRQMVTRAVRSASNLFAKAWLKRKQDKDRDAQSRYESDRSLSMSPIPPENEDNLQTSIDENDREEQETYSEENEEGSGYGEDESSSNLSTIPNTEDDQTQD